MARNARTPGQYGGDMGQGVPLVVADGYHRICAICYYDESAPIPCRLVSA